VYTYTLRWGALEWSTTTGWRICIGCLKVLVSLRKAAAKNRALLRNMTNKDKAFDVSSLLCTHFTLKCKDVTKSHLHSKKSTQMQRQERTYICLIIRSATQSRLPSSWRTDSLSHTHIHTHIHYTDGTSGDNMVV